MKAFESQPDEIHPAKRLIENHLDRFQLWGERNTILILAYELPQIAKEYGATAELLPNVQKECFRLIWRKFPELSVNDIRDAYREYAINPEAKGGEMFYGEFNAMNLAKVLSHYVAGRTAKINKILKIEQEEKEKARQAARVAAKRENAERTFIDNLMIFVREGKSWQEVPFFWWELVVEKGIVQLSKGEYQEIFADAKTLAEIQRGEMKEQAKQLNKNFQTIEPFETTHKRIARQLAIFRKLNVEHETQELENYFLNLNLVSYFKVLEKMQCNE